MKKLITYLCVLFLATLLQAQEVKQQDTLSVEENALHLSLKETGSGELAALVYPNPVTNRIYIKFELKNIDSVTMDIEDMKGMILVHEHYYDLQDGDVRIVDITLLEDGLYILRLNSFNYIFNKRIRKIPG